MVSNLPSSSEVKTLMHTLNSQFEICSATNGIVGVQQNLWAYIMECLTQLVQIASRQDDIPNATRIKLVGDGTQITRGLFVVNLGFTVLEGQ